MDSDSTYVDLGLSLSDTSLAAPTIVCAESPECPFRDRSERNEISWLQLSEIEANVSGHGFHNLFRMKGFQSSLMPGFDAEDILSLGGSESGEASGQKCSVINDTDDAYDKCLQML